MVPELEAAPQGTLWGRVGEPGSKGGGWHPSQCWRYLSDSRLQWERQELGRGQSVTGVFFSYLKKIKAGLAHTGFLLVPFECLPPPRACFLAALRLPHSPGLGGAHKARQLELKIYAKQLLTDCKGVQLCAGCSLGAVLKGQEVSGQPGVKRQKPVS